MVVRTPLRQPAGGLNGVDRFVLGHPRVGAAGFRLLLALPYRSALRRRLAGVFFGRAFVLLNRAPPTAFVPLLHPSFEMLTNDGTFSSLGLPADVLGREEAADYLREWVGEWDAHTYSPRELVQGERLVAALLVASGRARATGIEMSMELGFVYEFEHGWLRRQWWTRSWDEAVDAVAKGEIPRAGTL